jgi:uncharacterized protein (DUF1697 family)
LVKRNDSIIIYGLKWKTQIERGFGMTIFIALLRGINVGGHNKIKMAELKSLLESMGLLKVKTYIQSGNVVFESEQSADLLSGRMEDEIKNRFGLTVPVVLRTAEELAGLIENCPFPVEGLGEGESVSVAFLADFPEQEGMELLAGYRTELDDYQLAGKDVYLFFRHSIRDSKLASQGLPKLGVPVTVRNWNTVLKLDAMARELA